LADLIRTTEGFQTIKHKSNETLTQINSLNLLVEPLKLENTRLVRDNNELHMALIQSKEDSQLRSNSVLLSLQKLESDNSDLKFLLTQKEKVVKNLEEEVATLKFNYENVISKDFKGTNVPIQPRILQQGKFSQRDLIETQNSFMNKEDYVNELRTADEKCSHLNSKLLIQ